MSGHLVLMSPSKADRAAVTSVLGVVLMIFIGIAVAGTIWYMANKIKSNANSENRGVHVTFQRDSTGLPNVKVTKVSPTNLDWVTDLAIRGTCSPTLNGATFPTATGTPVRAGDVLGCSSG